MTEAVVGEDNFEEEENETELLTPDSGIESESPPMVISAPTGPSNAGRRRVVKNFGKDQLRASKPCRYCHKRFPTLFYLKMHERIHHSGPQPFRCSSKRCNMRFRSKFDQSVHYRTHHTRATAREKPFTCYACWQSFSQKINLLSHQFLHHSKSRQMYRCKYCSAKFLTAGEWGTHERIHDTMGTNHN